MTHTHSANPFVSPIAALAGVPVRIAVHHNPADSFSRVARAVDRLAFHSGCYSSMVTVSGGVSHSFARHGEAYRKRLHRIYNGIEAAGDPIHMDARQHYRIPQEHALLINVGRLARQKNQGVLFGMLKEIPYASLLLVGEGELRLELRAAAAAIGVADRVRFTGELSPGEVQSLLQQADLFLLPSVYESFCIAAVEAMQAGLPVLASDLSCLREVLGDEQMFFSLDNPPALAHTVRVLLASPEKRAAMASAGVARADRFSVERMVGEYECLMAEELLYATRWKSAAHDLGGLNPLGRIPRIHD